MECISWTCQSALIQISHSFADPSAEDKCTDSVYGLGWYAPFQFPALLMFVLVLFGGMAAAFLWKIYWEDTPVKKVKHDHLIVVPLLHFKYPTIQLMWRLLSKVVILVPFIPQLYFAISNEIFVARNKPLVGSSKIYSLDFGQIVALVLILPLVPPLIRAFLEWSTGRSSASQTSLRSAYILPLYYKEFVRIGRRGRGLAFTSRGKELSPLLQAYRS